MTTPTRPTNPPTATLGAKVAAALGVVEAEAAVSLAEALAFSPALEARDGPETFEGLAIVEPVDEGP
jgi:hypothetical protein